MTIATNQTALASEQLKIHSATGHLQFAAATTLTIAGGSVTPTQTFHRIDTEGAAATDDLDTIAAGADGQGLYIRPANDARTVVVKHNTNNILCAGKRDIALDDIDDWCVLIYDSNQSKWLASGMSLSVSDKLFAYKNFR